MRSFLSYDNYLPYECNFLSVESLFLFAIDLWLGSFAGSQLITTIANSCNRLTMSTHLGWVSTSVFLVLLDYIYKLSNQLMYMKRMTLWFDNLQSKNSENTVVETQNTFLRYNNQAKAWNSLAISSYLSLQLSLYTLALS